MSDMIERIKLAIRHEAKCPMSIGQEELLAQGIDPAHAFVGNGNKGFEECVVCSGAPEDHVCECRRREMVTFLERLRNPTEEMRRAFDECQRNGEGFYVTWDAMLQAAQEDL